MLKANMESVASRYVGQATVWYTYLKKILNGERPLLLDRVYFTFLLLSFEEVQQEMKTQKEHPWREEGALGQSEGEEFYALVMEVHARLPEEHRVNQDPWWCIQVYREVLSRLQKGMSFQAGDLLTLASLSRFFAEIVLIADGYERRVPQAKHTGSSGSGL